ncbi:MAG: hypothetical protein IJM36_06055 [Acholeplasmatales bacterium]|nr:hypothetical protein [Acholeplasmatales bacterium]
MKLFKTITATTLAVAAALVTTTITNAKTEAKKASFGYGNSVTVNYDLKYYKNREIAFSVNPSMTTYFHNLYRNIGYNRFNSCGYVATGMLLSYYDTFWDDGFIAEKFDYSRTPDDNSSRGIVKYSPGVRNEYGVKTDIALNSASNILKHYKKLADKGYFVPYLHQLASEAKFYSNILNKEIPYYNQANEIGTKYGEKYSSSNVGAFGNNQLGDFLKYYLDNETEFEGKYSIKSKSIELNPVGDTDDTEIREFMAKYLDEGYPILTCTNDWLTRPTSSNPSEYEKLSLAEGHVQVVYDYIRNYKGELEFTSNYGKVADYRYETHGNTEIMLTDSEIITEAYVLIPSFSKSGSDNYIYTSGESIDMSNMIGLFAKNYNMQEYVDKTRKYYNEDSSIKKINNIAYYAPKKQYASFSTSEDADTSFNNINLSYNKKYSHNLIKYLYDLITKRKANYDDYEYEIIPNISYEYDEDQDTSGEYWNENCYLSVTVKDERKAKMSFDVVNSKTLNLYCIDYLK